MATIHNTDLTKELKEGAKLQQLRDVIPSQLAEKVVPVMEVNPKLLRRCNVVRGQEAINNTSGTIYTTPTDKDFFLVACGLGVIKDATSTSILTTLRATIDGVSQKILSIPSISLTPQISTISNSFPTPLKIDRGTSILLVNSTNVANITCSGSIVGYLIDNINA